MGGGASGQVLGYSVPVGVLRVSVRVRLSIHPERTDSRGDDLKMRSGRTPGLCSEMGISGSVLQRRDEM